MKNIIDKIINIKYNDKYLKEYIYLFPKDNKKKYDLIIRKSSSITSTFINEESH